ncbi:MAG: hypothetical protein RMK99_12445 [Anaerolineales bacterium]|nr:hypothetical protein [Anaerolineales bacterium]
MDKIERELQSALAAQVEGNPGKARVCARRAAGLAIRAYYRRRDGTGWGGDAMAQLKRLQADVSVPEHVRNAAARLTTTVDFEHNLPFAEEPVEDARRIIGFVSGAT